MKIILEIAANKRYCAACGCLDTRYNYYCNGFQTDLIPGPKPNDRNYAIRCKACKRAEQLYHNLNKKEQP